MGNHAAYCGGGSGDDCSASGHWSGDNRVLVWARIGLDWEAGKIPFEVTVRDAQQTDAEWRVVMKIIDSTLGFSSHFWTDDHLLNPDAPVNTNENAKYTAFNDVAFDRIKMCVGEPTANCVEHQFEGEGYGSARELFSSGYIRDPTVDQQGFLDAFAPAPGSYSPCGMQRPGFNIECNDGNKARWGYCVNCASQGCQLDENNDADATIGIGLAGQSGPEMGAGWTNYFASGAGTCSPNSMQSKPVWLYVRGGDAGTTTRVLVTVLDVNEPPTFANQEIAVDENIFPRRVLVTDLLALSGTGDVRAEPAQLLSIRMVSVTPEEASDMFYLVAERCPSLHSKA
jgi:hypothetical protein